MPAITTKTKNRKDPGLLLKVNLELSDVNVAWMNANDEVQARRAEWNALKADMVIKDRELMKALEVRTTIEDRLKSLNELKKTLVVMLEETK